MIGEVQSLSKDFSHLTSIFQGFMELFPIINVIVKNIFFKKKKDCHLNF